MRGMQASKRSAAWQLCCMCLLGLALQLTAAQDTNNAQGALLFSMGKYLANNDLDKLAALGWVNGGNPCSGTWTGVTCNPEGQTVTSVSLPNQGLIGSLPPESSIWGGLPGLTSLDLSGNSLGGQVPSQLSAAAQLKNINLSGNGAICGTSATPEGITITAEGTKLGSDCATAAAEAPAATNTSTEAPASPATNDSTPANGSITPPPAAADTTTNPPASDAAEAVTLPAAAPAAPAPPPAPITDAPICSCALRGYGSDECAAALKGVCGGGEPPALCKSGANGGLADPSSDETAAEQLGQYLADACFPGQGREVNICTCTQNLLSTDCAKARVNLCVSKDPLCLPFQNIIDASGSSNAGAVGKVTPYLDEKCPVSEPSVPGVRATMEFDSLSLGQYITRQYTQNVANALSAVTNVPSSSISALDVRPFLGQGQGGRALLQDTPNGVQATYFLTTDDPASVSQLLTTAAADKSLSRQLSQYGISSQASILRIQSFVQPSASGGASSSRGFPMWALAPIIVGIVLLLGLLALLWFCCVKRNKKSAQEYAPATKEQALPVAKTYDYTPAAPLAAYPDADTGVKSARVVTPNDLPVSRSVKVTTVDDGDASTRDTELPAAPSSLVSVKSGSEVGSAASSAAAAWKSNVRPASGQLPTAGSATSSMSGAKSAQQAERAKFWAQFQETWQQVRQNQNINDGEPGTPSSGTNWTDVTGQQSPKKHRDGSSGAGEPGH